MTNSYGGTPVIIYVINTKVERIGTESDVSIISKLNMIKYILFNISCLFVYDKFNIFCESHFLNFEDSNKFCLNQGTKPFWCPLNESANKKHIANKILP